MLALRHFGICGYLREFCRYLRDFCQLVISNVFVGNFHFAQLNPQTLKKHPGHRIAFQKQGVLGVSGV